IGGAESGAGRRPAHQGGVPDQRPHRRPAHSRGRDRRTGAECRRHCRRRGAVSAVVAYRQRTWRCAAWMLLATGLTLLPWTVRNYVVLDRLIPVKSNASYELYQSQCLQPDGLIQRWTFSNHPGGAGRPEGVEYRQMGEIAYLERKREQFWEAVRSDP